MNKYFNNRFPLFVSKRGLKFVHSALKHEIVRLCREITISAEKENENDEAACLLYHIDEDVKALLHFIEGGELRK